MNYDETKRKKQKKYRLVNIDGVTHAAVEWRSLLG
jgi:hypothetical protein